MASRSAVSAHSPISVLAIVESFVAAAASLFLAISFTSIPLLVGILASPFFQLRTEYSQKLSVLLLRRHIRREHKWICLYYSLNIYADNILFAFLISIIYFSILCKFGIILILLIASMFSFFGILLITIPIWPIIIFSIFCIVFRVYSTVYSILFKTNSCISSIPDNCRTNCCIVDLTTPIEFMPGLRDSLLKRKESKNANEKAISEFYVNFIRDPSGTLRNTESSSVAVTRKLFLRYLVPRIKLSNYRESLFRKLAHFLAKQNSLLYAGNGRLILYGIFILPTLSFRWSVKATSAVYWPILYSVKGSFGKSPTSLLEEFREKKSSYVSMAMGLVFSICFILRQALYVQFQSLAHEMDSINHRAGIFIGTFIPDDKIPLWHIASLINGFLAWFLYYASIKKLSKTTPG